MKKRMSPEQLKVELQKSIEQINESGLGVVECANNGETKSTHPVTRLIIIGGARRVEFYPSTGTAYSNGVKGKMKAARGSCLADAIRIAKQGK